MKNTIPLWPLLCLALLCGCSSDDDTVQSSDPTSNNNDDPVAERTLIPDSAFEQALVDLGFDDVVDGSMLKSSAESVVNLVINELEISSLSGLRDFSNLENLWAQNNNLTSIDLSGNNRLKFVYVDGNDLTSLQVASLGILEKIGASNNQLTAIDVTNNTGLQILEIGGNQIEAINVSANPELNVFSVVNNPLTCIQVNSQQLANIPAQWEKDPEDRYALNCN